MLNLRFLSTTKHLEVYLISIVALIDFTEIKLLFLAQILSHIQRVRDVEVTIWIYKIINKLQA